jgi:tetratricopeptide (TPR) repeat protein
MKNILLSTILLFHLQLVAQENLKQSAQTKFNNQEWEASAKDYKKYLKKNNTDSSAWYSLAVSQLRMEQYQESVKSFKEAKRTNFSPTFVLYNMGKAYAFLEDQSNMINSLKEGAELGLSAYSLLLTDPAFSKYQEDKAFIEILSKVRINSFPCLSTEENRHFDFWLGEWDVFLPNGTQAGSNSITLDEAGCAINERYTARGAFGGQSINFYDPGDKKWHQYWVGSRGGVLNYSEIKKEEGLLQFLAEVVNPADGSISHSRLTFTLNEDGTVRQLFENSTDDGKNWTAAFDGLYKKK